MTARAVGTSAVRIGAVGLAVAFVLALVPVWPLLLLEHFRVQYTWLGAGVAAGAAALRLRGWFDVALIAALLHLATVAPDLTRSTRAAPAGGLPVRVLVLNVLTENRSFDAVRALIRDTRPDVIGLVEVDDRWLDELAGALDGYAGRLEHPRDDNFGVALYARGPLAGGVVTLGALPGIEGVVELGGARLGVIVVHPLPPMSGAAVDEHRTTLDAAADRARSLGGSAVILGDLNATPWSTAFRRLVDRSGLCDTRAGFGVQATFPADSLLLRIPIDHVLASCAIGVAARAIERDVGSDHLPIVVDLVIPVDL